MITFVGDVHGKFKLFEKILQTEDNVVQVGDLGIGFEDHTPLTKYRFAFIHGNHDNPELCGRVPGFLGRFGHNYAKSMFWVSGAYSIDQKQRFVGLDYWDNEELSYRESLQAIERYSNCEPRIMVTHDAPGSALSRIFSHHSEYQHSLTNNMLENMFEIHQPKIWVFGHHHRSFDFMLRGTRFIGLAELETKQIS